MIIMIGQGIFFIVDVPNEPKSGDILNLGDDQVIMKGRYRVTREGSKPWLRRGGLSTPITVEKESEIFLTENNR